VLVVTRCQRGQRGVEQRVSEDPGAEVAVSGVEEAVPVPDHRGRFGATTCVVFVWVGVRVGAYGR